MSRQLVQESPTSGSNSIRQPFETPGSDAFIYTQYRSICKTAVLCLVFAILGIASFIAQIFLILPLLGIIFGGMALVSLARYPDELIGKTAARIGLTLSLLCFIGSIGMYVWIYNTEVPDGYTRMSFYDLKPNRRSSLHYGERAAEMDGQKVFVRGYVRPGQRKYDLKNFMMVGDWGQCCFGGNPKMTDVVAVSIKTDETVDYGLGVRKIGGVFRLNKNPRQTSDSEVPRVLYEIEADYVK